MRGSHHVSPGEQRQREQAADDESRFADNMISLLGLNDEHAPPEREQQHEPPAPGSYAQNPHAVAARARKVEKLYEALRSRGITAEGAMAFSAKAWNLVAKYAGVNPPSEETIRLVIEALRKAEEKF